MAQTISNNSSDTTTNTAFYESSQLIEPATSNGFDSRQFTSIVPSSPMNQTELPPPYSTLPKPVMHSASRNIPPPSYSDVINNEVPPPSYQSLFGQVREARKTSNGFIDFLRKIILLILGTLGCTIIIGFTVVIPFTMIMVGGTYMDECPVENIPTFLLIGGLVWMFKNLMNCWTTCHRSNDESYTEAVIQQRKNESLLNCFLFGWFIAGCILVYRVYEPEYDDPRSPNYCNKTVYLYAFWLITSTFIVLGIFISCLLCLAVSSVFANSDQQTDEDA